MLSMLHRDFDQELFVKAFFEFVEVLLLSRLVFLTSEEDVDKWHLFIKESNQGVEESLQKVRS